MGARGPEGDHPRTTPSTDGPIPMPGPERAPVRRPAILLLLLLLAASARGGEFRFAWLTDTHVGGATGAEDLRRAVADLNARTDLAFVILSGDITELGSDAELREARAILDSLRHPWHIIPGNHDTKWSASGCTSFNRIFGADRFVLSHGGLLFVGLHQGPVMRMGDGHFAPEDIRWLDSVFAETPPEQPLVFVTHYPLDTEVDNWYDVTRRLRSRNTQVILHGHGHANRAAVQDGLCAVMGRSNLRGRAETGAYTLVDVRGDSMLFADKVHGGPPAAPWHGVGAAGRARAAATPPLPPPDFAVNAHPASPRERWSFSCGATVTTSPAPAGELVLVGDALGRMRALAAATGKPGWTYQAGGPIHSTPAVSGGRAVFGSADGVIHCLRVRDGRRLWAFAARGPVLGSPVIRDGTVYIGASDSSFRALRLSDGSLRWEFDGLRGFVESRPLVEDGRVIVGAWDGNLYALDAANGALLWTWSNGSASRGLSPAACIPVAAAGKVFIVAPDRYMTALDAASGRQVWRSRRYMVREAVGRSADGRTVFARTMRDTVVAVKAAPDSLEAEWVTNAGFGYDIAPCMPVERAGEVVVGTKNGLVLGLDRRDGKVLWKRKIGVTVVATPAAVPAGLLLADLDGRVVLLERTHAGQ